MASLLCCRFLLLLPFVHAAVPTTAGPQGRATQARATTRAGRMTRKQEDQKQTPRREQKKKRKYTRSSARADGRAKGVQAAHSPLQARFRPYFRFPVRLFSPIFFNFSLEGRHGKKLREADSKGARQAREGKHKTRNRSDTHDSPTHVENTQHNRKTKKKGEFRNRERNKEDTTTKTQWTLYRTKSCWCYSLFVFLSLPLFWWHFFFISEQTRPGNNSP